MINVQELRSFVEASGMVSSLSGFKVERVTSNLCSFAHASGLRISVLVGKNSRGIQIYFRNLVSPAVLWIWNERICSWELSDTDFLAGEVDLRSVSDFIEQFGLEIYANLA